jgi:carboxylesterase type B
VGLLASKLLYRHKVLQSLVIYIDFNLRLGFLELSSLLGQQSYNSKHLFIIDLIVALGRCYSLREVSNWVLLVIWV